MEKIAVAIDGPSGAGKSTIARAAAQKLGFIYVDTGALYRSIALVAYRANLPTEDVSGVCELIKKSKIEIRYEDGVQNVCLDNENVSEIIRTPEVTRYASLVSAVKEVREYLLDVQRDMAKTNNVIMDGRDIGTVILPNAQVKIFLTASAEERAKRRYDELVAKGIDVNFDEVLHDMQERDLQDYTRKTAPLKKADDAIELNTDKLNLTESIQLVLEIITKAM